MKAVITVTGKDCVGIIADVSAVCAKVGANIVEITQSVLSEYFAMIMIVDIDALNLPFSDFSEEIGELGKRRGLDIRALHEDIFDAMHRI